MPRVIRVGLRWVIVIVNLIVVIVNDCSISTTIIALIIYPSLLCIFIVFLYSLGYDMSVFILVWFNILATSN